MVERRDERSDDSNFTRNLLLIVAVVAVVGLLTNSGDGLTGFAAKKSKSYRLPGEFVPGSAAQAKAPSAQARPAPCREGVVVNQIQCPHQAKFYQKLVCRNKRIVSEPIINRTTQQPVSCAPEIIILPEPFVGVPMQSHVSRSFSISPPIPSGQVDVLLRVSELDEIGQEERSYSIEENVPLGWQILDAGALTPQGNTIRIMVAEGLGGTVQDTSYTYRVRAPSNPGQYLFNGTYTFESMGRSYTTGGDRSIQIN